MSTGVEPTITLTDDGEWWLAKDTETAVTSLGRPRHGVLDDLDEALAGYHGEGDAPGDEALPEPGVDPAETEMRSLDDPEIHD